MRNQKACYLIFAECQIYPEYIQCFHDNECLENIQK